MPTDMKLIFDAYEEMCQADNMDFMLYSDQQVPQTLPVYSEYENQTDLYNSGFQDSYLNGMTTSSLPLPIAGCPTVTAVSNDQEVLSDASPIHVTDIDQYTTESTIYDTSLPNTKGTDLVSQCSQQDQIVHDQIYELATTDIKNECISMKLAPEPTQWSPDDVRKWIMHMCTKYEIPDVCLDLFQMNGKCLCLLSEEDFLARSPAGGSYFYALLLIWKHHFKVQKQNEMPIYQENNLTDYFPGFDIPRQCPSPNCLSPASPESCSLDSITSAVDSPKSLGQDVDDTMFTYQTPVHTKKSKAAGSPPRSAEHKQTIHLWEFLRELLQKPESFGSCIKWLDARKGIFKVEDSVKLAQEWGRRKNRPAMNYDKLSRSIRQYYRKKIIKKTDQSKRLVYQFYENYL